MRSAGEQDAFAQEVWVRPPVHLSFDHLDAVDVAFDGAGAAGQGEAVCDSGPVLAQPGGEAAQRANPRSRNLGQSPESLGRRTRLLGLRPVRLPAGGQLVTDRIDGLRREKKLPRRLRCSGLTALRSAFAWPSD
jgi:hypothetical protein